MNDTMESYQQANLSQATKTDMLIDCMKEDLSCMLSHHFDDLCEQATCDLSLEFI